MEQKLLKDVKKGEFFTKKPIEEPKETQVFSRGDQDKSERKYEVSRFSDFCLVSMEAKICISAITGWFAERFTADLM